MIDKALQVEIEAVVDLLVGLSKGTIFFEVPTDGDFNRSHLRVAAKILTNIAWKPLSGPALASLLDKTPVGQAMAFLLGMHSVLRLFLLYSGNEISATDQDIFFEYAQLVRGKTLPPPLYR